MKYGCIGEKLSHSFSKEIHEKFAPYTYELCEIKRENLEDFLKKRDFCGINVTIPYKEEVIRYLDEISENAKKIGAVNTIVNREGKLYGDNTDILGMKKLFEKANVDLNGKTVLISGSGGTSKTARALCENMGAKKIYRASRSEKEGCITYDKINEISGDIEVIINTTPIGMYPKTDALSIDAANFKNLCGALDAVYNPLRTLFVQSAARRGVKASGGLYMLVAQAVCASEIFLNKKYDDDVIDRVYKEILNSKRNIVLIGMPSCGKTTVGKILSQKTNMEFIDSDEEIKKEYQMSASEIIKSRGEKDFRKKESDIYKKIGDETGKIIATGGGAVLFEENMINLKKNGILIFIDRKLLELSIGGDRPLSSGKAALENMYKTRYPLYKKYADTVINPQKSPEDTAEYILELTGEKS